MGVKISSLAQIPADIDIKYYVYLLTSHFQYEADIALREAFDILAREAGKQDFVVIQGYVGEFGGEVMNAYSIDGLDSKEILPALLISSVNPHKFKKVTSIDREGPFRQDEKIILISLKQKGITRDDVYRIIESILKDIKKGEKLSNFEVSKTKRTRFLDALILEPNFAGFGIDLKKIWKFLSEK